MASGALPIRVGDVLRRALPIWGRVIIPLGPIFAIAVIPVVVAGLMQGGAHAGYFRSGGPSWAPILGIVAVVFQVIGAAAVVRGAWDVMECGQVDFGAALVGANRRFLALLGTAILAGLGIVGLSLLLLVPGLIAVAALFVATPICLLEGLGPWTSLQRSAALTRGSRWRVFALCLVVCFLFLMEAGCEAAAARFVGDGALAVIQVLGETAANVFYMVVVTVAYRDLVVAKEGVRGDRLAAVFD
jgi:hypothetical protein